MKGNFKIKSVLFYADPKTKVMKRNRTETLMTVSEYENFHFFCDFFLIIKFKTVIKNLKRNRKKNYFNE